MIEKMKSNAEVVEAGLKYVYGNFNRLPIAIARGEGCRTYDFDGNEYLDFVGGVAVNGLGHCHPVVANALREAAETVVHCSNYYWAEPAVQLAKLIVENSCFDRVLYTNSGAESNEACIKLARKYAKMQGKPERYTVLTMANSFHGRTLATCAATGQEKIQKGFEPMPAGFQYAEFNDLASVEAAIDDTVCAIMLEPIQGEGGVCAATEEFMKGVRALCDKHDLLMMVDEVQVGCGRCGALFAHQLYGVEPDVMSLAKALGSGVPIGACCARGKAAETLKPGEHGSTYAGSPLVTSVALATLDYMISEDLFSHVKKIGAYMKEKLTALVGKYDSAVAVRGEGLILGLVLNKPGDEIVKKCYDNKVLINCTAGTVLRFIPPLIITEKDVDEVIAAVDAALAECAF